MNKRLALNYALLTLISLVLLELTSYGLIAMSRPIFSEPIRRTVDIYREQSAHIRRWLALRSRGRDIVDSTLGWRYRSSFDSPRNAINSQGLRSRREYSESAPAGVLRVAAFGDSFVYGNEVINENAWARLVETMFDNVEILNYGVGGYGLDQALIRFREEGLDLAPDIVLIGFIADDIRRVTNVYQRFASTNAGVFTKPRFILAPDGGLDLLPPPITHLDNWAPVLNEPKLIRAWGEHDQWYEPLIYENALYDYSALVRLASSIWIRLDNRYVDPNRLFLGDRLNRASEAYQLQMRIFSAFVDEVRESGVQPIVLILPSRGELTAHLDGRETVYRQIADDLSALGIAYWDAKSAFPAPPASVAIDEWLEDWFEPGGHYSPEGNRIVATWLGPRILELGEQL